MFSLPSKPSFLVFAMLLAHQSFGASTENKTDACDAPVDLRSPGMAMERIPVTSQGYTGTNLCGFFASSAILDSRRKTALAPNPKFISPLALAVELAIQADVPIWFPIQNTTDPLTNVPGRWGQVVCPILKFAREHGACVDPSLRAGDLETSARLSDKTTAIYAVLFQWGMKSKKDRKAELETVAKEVERLYQELLPEPSKPLESFELRKWMSENEEKPYNVIYKMFFQACEKPENRVALNDIPECQSSYFGSLDFFGIRIGKKDPLRTRGAMDKLHELLSAKSPSPVAMAFCGNILKEGRAYPGYSILSEACSAHWVLVMGRKKIDGKCHFLIRNSAKPVYPYSKDWILDGRDVWVDAEVLNRAIYALQWL